MLKTPIVFIVFNRPDTTRAVFQAIRAVRPARLLVIADGPRADRPGEPDRCAETRAIIDAVDWPCEVQTNYSSANLGCKKRIISGLDWAFGLVEEAIVLEDDVVPHASFFPFCEEMLERYRDDVRVGMINGGSFLRRPFKPQGSYYFSRFGHVWGWASWRRVWQQYDGDLTRWPEKKAEGWLLELLGNAKVASAWTRSFDSVHQKRIDTWDYQVDFCNWIHGMCAVAPSVNMVSNIGFGVEATHTKEHSLWSAMDALPMTFPLVHPESVAICEAADAIEYLNYLPITWVQRKKRRLRRIAAGLQRIFGRGK